MGTDAKLWTDEFLRIYGQSTPEQLSEIMFTWFANAIDAGESKSLTVNDMMWDIEQFHAKFGLEYYGKPRALEGALGRFRRQFMQEELGEYNDHVIPLGRAVAQKDNDAVTHHLEEQLDALVDLVYVALGTAYMHGFHFREAWRRVHSANMLKMRVARAEDSKRGSTFDVVKPEGWVPPTHTELVQDHAHREVPWQAPNRTTLVASPEPDTAEPTSETSPPSEVSLGRGGIVASLSEHSLKRRPL